MPANALPSVTLAAITKDNWKPAIRLAIEDRQKHFVAPNWYSILEALFSGGTLHSRAIMDGERMVGFTMFGKDDDTNTIWIVRLMIDKSSQGKGYGRAAMHLILDTLKRLYQPDAIYISFEPDNEVARRLYVSLGFEDTGRIEEGELIFKLALTSTST